MAVIDNNRYTDPWARVNTVRTLMDTDLLRQRRNLILVSSALLLFDFANVTVTKVSVMGTELLIGDVKVLIYFAWAMWGYFLLRYYQYLHEEKDLGILTGIKSQFDARAFSYPFRKLNKTQINGTIEFECQGFRWAYSVKEYDAGHLKMHETAAGSLPVIQTYWWLARAVYYVAVRTPKATDHILPYALAIAAPVVSIVKAAQGV